MKYEKIEDAVADIMSKDGADGHTDGSNIIAYFIESLLKGAGEEWIDKYRKENDIF